MEGSWEYTKTNIWNFTMEQLSIIYFKLKIWINFIHCLLPYLHCLSPKSAENSTLLHDVRVEVFMGMGSNTMQWCMTIMLWRIMLLPSSRWSEWVLVVYISPWPS
jgi:hypothetical protein